MKITPLLTPKLQHSYNKDNNNKNHTAHEPQFNTNYLPQQFNDYMLFFTARVDKGLERFYETNKDRMPSTVKDYIENLSEEELQTTTPLQAQQDAYALISIAETIDDIKGTYDDDELFKGLINPEDSKARRGILSSYRENAELLSLYGEGILKDNSNLTVYLVKKVFLEAKTIDEINKDLENDLNENFKADFKAKHKDSPYVYGTTLKALGIKTPEFEYQQSLRYTKDGYADMVGGKIKTGLDAFWKSIPPEDRNERARKKVRDLENWWAGLPEDKKLDMAAGNITEEEMLKMFQEARRKRALKKNTSAQNNTESKERRPHVKVGSEKLANDELFIMWTKNKFALYEASLTPQEKKELNSRRTEQMVNRWAEMTPNERTDYISKMKSGSERQRFIMIDAWNNNIDLIKDLSKYLKINHIYKPADMIYSSMEFSSFQSKIMTRFWNEHPEHATALGEAMKASSEKVKYAINNDTFEELKREIFEEKKLRIKEIENFKTNSIQSEQASDAADNKTPQYIEEFKAVYIKAHGERLRCLPKEYLEDYFKAIEDLPKEYVISWTKGLKGEPLTPQENTHLNKIASFESENTAKLSRTMEIAGATILYYATNNPEVFLMSHSDVKNGLWRLESGIKGIAFHSEKLNRDFNMPFVYQHFDKKLLTELYTTFKRPLKESEYDYVIDKYFPAPTTQEVQAFLKSLGLENNTKIVTPGMSDEQKAELKEYLKQYGRSLHLIFSNDDAYPIEAKKAFYRKFIANMPEKLSFAKENCVLSRPQAFEKENKISNAAYFFEKRFNFLPKNYIAAYQEEIVNYLRPNSLENIETVKNAYKNKRNSVNDTARTVRFPKENFSSENKLKTLAMEQALADVMYDATGAIEVYSMQIEELCDNMEIYQFIKGKDIKNSERTYPSISLNQDLTIKLNKQPHFRKLQQLYNEYMNELTEWMNVDVKRDGFGYFEDLLGIFNPDELNVEKDNAIAKRIEEYKLNLKHI